MIWQVCKILFELVQLGRKAESEKDLEILLLRQQLTILQRKQPGPYRDIAPIDKLKLTLLTVRLKTVFRKTTHELRTIIVSCSPKRSCVGTDPGLDENGIIVTNERVGVRVHQESLNN